MIYLDHAATTACSAEVVESMLPFFRSDFANASSIDHIPGAAARSAVDSARSAVAELVGAQVEDVIFTGGSTEANNLALSVDRPVFTSSVEHPSVLDPFVARKRADDAMFCVDRQGRVDVDQVREQLRSRNGSALLSFIATNNETGVEQQIDVLASAAKEFGALLHFDATQAVGTRFLATRKSGIDGASLSAHKIQGPKGVGALVAGPALRKAIKPILRGGGHERGFRSGTLNVPAIVGFGTAARLASSMRSERNAKLRALRELFIASLRDGAGDRVIETIQDAPVSPHVLSIRLKGINSRALLGAVRNDLAFSLGSACATNKTEPSHVLVALGIDKRAISETFRVSFSAEQHADEINMAAKLIANACIALSDYSLSA